MRKLRKDCRDWKIGYKWGSLEIISERCADEVIPGKKRKGYFWCRCVCEKEIKVRCDFIHKEQVKSCGCLKNYYTSLNHNKFKCTLLDETGKVCGKCKIKRQSNDFVKTSKSKDKLSYICQFCKKDARLIADYGITYQEYIDLFKKQGNKCACCGTKKTKRFCIDHLHEEPSNGPIKIRGIICITCNSGIGLLGDTLKDCKNAVKYLQAFENRNKDIINDTKPTDSKCPD